MEKKSLIRPKHSMAEVVEPEEEEEGVLLLLLLFLLPGILNPL
jgi:hypothetical protein